MQTRAYIRWCISIVDPTLLMFCLTATEWDMTSLETKKNVSKKDSESVTHPNIHQATAVWKKNYSGKIKRRLKERNYFSHNVKLPVYDNEFFVSSQAIWMKMNE